MSSAFKSYGLIIKANNQSYKYCIKYQFVAVFCVRVCVYGR